MARPQTEEGHTKIANELMDALMRVNFSSYERRVLDCVLRKTYGWNKKADRISYTQFEEATGLNRWHVARALGHLITRNVIAVSGNGHKLEYGLQKDYELWQSLPKQVTKSLPNEVTNAEIESLPIQEKSLPIQEKTLPVEVMKSLPKQVNTKARKHITKAYNKSMGVQSPYFEKIRLEFSDIDDFDTQVKNCEAWHNEHHPKTASRHRLSALRNWLTKERKFRREREKGGANGGTGEHRQDTQRDAYDWEEAPESDDTS